MKYRKQIILLCKWMGASGVIEHKIVKLNDSNDKTGLPSQMSDKWIQYVQDKLRANEN
jgi:hypothetical protein